MSSESPTEQTRSEIPSGGAYVIGQPRGIVSQRARSLARRIPGAKKVADRAFYVGREANALLYLVRASVAQRLGRRAPSVRLDVQRAPTLSFPPELRVDWTGEGPGAAWFPHQVVAPLLPNQWGKYPEGTGCKIVTGIAEPSTVHSIVLAANLMYLRRLGPRLFDVIKDADGDHVAFAVEDSSGPVTDRGEAERILREVQTLVDSRLITGRENWRDPSHVRRVNGHPRYAAFELLSVDDPSSAVRYVLDDRARADLHFGTELSLRGGRYLYQSVPVASELGRRDSARRWRMIRGMLADAGIDSAATVLDVGCNAGMMLAGALADGAQWGFGWDLPSVATQARSLLLALGFTRFDIVGAELKRDYPLMADIPARVRPELDDAVVLYLAVRHHIDFLSELGRMPWRALVYEGGETESSATIEQSLAGLRALCDFEVASVVDFRDAETRARPLAVVVRQ